MAASARSTFSPSGKRNSEPPLPRAVQRRKRGMIQQPRIVLIGEGMLELSASDGEGWRLGHGGDSLNTAIHLARLGHNVAYLTALGADPFSTTLREAWAAEGVDTTTILADPDRQPGLYAIKTDDLGERTFFYWRQNSAASKMHALPGFEAELERAAEAGLVGYSLITLAILPPEARRRLFALCDSVRQNGGQVAFDANYRPRLWTSEAEARDVCDEAIAHCDIGLPSLQDEELLRGPTDVGSLTARWHGLGARELAVKLGSAGSMVSEGGRDHLVPAKPNSSSLDTSGAGDAFNAGYLSARSQGLEPAEAAQKGNTLAGWVIARPGAIPCRDEEYPA
jgi:2-dehydro-3-deoxygluconokinase